jgi:hypothetical protein
MKEKPEVANMPNACHSMFESYVLLMCETLNPWLVLRKK